MWLGLAGRSAMFFGGICLVMLANAGCKSSGLALGEPPLLPEESVEHSSALDQQDQAVVRDADGTGFSIEQLVDRGLANHPSIRAAQLQVQALRHRIPQVRSLPDPMLNTTTYLAPVQTAAGEQAFALGVSQKFVNSDRRSTAASIACEEVRAAEAQLVQAQNELAERIRSSCFQLMYLNEAIQITGQDQELLQQISAMILQQYEVKRAVSQQDVLNVRVEQSKVENKLTELRQKKKSQLARLARWVAAAPNESVEISDSLNFQAASFDLEALTEQAISTRPELLKQLATQRREQKRIRLAQLQRKPDLTVGLNWIATSNSGISPVANGEDALLLGVGFNLPVRRARMEAAICEAKASTAAAAFRYESLRDEISEEIIDLIAQAESTQEMLGLLQEDILPKSKQALDLSIDGYTNNTVSFIELIEDWRSLLTYRLAEARAIATYSQTIASLSSKVGQVDWLGANTTSMAPENNPPTNDYFEQGTNESQNELENDE